MQIRLGITWEVEIDDDVHRQDVDTSGEDVRANEAACLTSLEVVVDPMSYKLENYLPLAVLMRHL